MDKKNTFIGVALLALAVALLFWNSNEQKKHDAARPKPVPATQAPTAAAAAPATAPATDSDAAPASAPVISAPAKIVSLENDSVRLDIDTLTGGLKTVALKKSADTLQHRKTPSEHPYLFNADNAIDQPQRAYDTPALALSRDISGRIGVPLAPAFAVVEEIPGDRVVLEAKLADGLRIVRTYTLPAAADVKAGKVDPNRISFKTVFRADGSGTIPAQTIRLNTGTLPQSHGDTANQFLGIATYDGDNFEKTAFSHFLASSGFFGMGAHAAPAFELKHCPANKRWQWVSVTNQFFAGIMCFDEATRARVSDFYIHPIFGVPAAGHAPAVATLTGDVGFALGELKPGQETEIGAEYYVGPREYARLAELGSEQEKTVQFGHLFWVISVDFLCKIFVVALSALHAMLPTGAWAWGFAIILLTVIIKALTWPLVMTQQRSAERMRRFSEPMKKIREKHKDDPAKMNKAMMELYREHRINPFAGCFPVLLQIPIFTGLFFTFQSLAQLRFQPFMWIPDLSMPDVIPGLETIAGFPIHILPVFMGATMLINMRLTPMPNVEGQQKIIFYAMMIMFPVICYGMPSALMLYYSVQNILTIGQTLLVRRKMQREVAAEPEVIDITPNPSKKKKKA